MKLRLFIPVFLMFACSSLLAQPEIVSISYEPDHAVLTRNEPPDPDIIYFWQGSSCGTLMNHSGATTIATTNGIYYLREYFSSSPSWATSCASTIVLIPDVIPPVLSGVTPGPIEEGDPIAATSNEDGMIFLVPAGTAANYSAVVSNRVASATATAHVAVALSTTGIGMGDFVVYAADEAHNLSAASAIITITDLTAPLLSNVTPGPVAEGDPIAATSNEDGMIYLVPAGTTASVGAIVAAGVDDAAATAGVPVSLSTAGISLGDYIVYAVDAYNNVSLASAVITVVDLTAPILSDVTAGPIEEGDPLAATSNEDGMIYLVPDGTAADYSTIVAAVVSSAAATANVPVSLSTAGIAMGDYIVYAADVFHNVSAASAVITVTDLTPPVLSDVTTGLVGEGDLIAATSNENGMIYLVPGGTASNVGAIVAAGVDDAAATAGVSVSLSTAGISLGDYIVYAVDAYNNVSSASATITVVDLTAPIISDVTAGPIERGTDILATSNENGMIYLVPDGTAPIIGDISAAQVAQAIATANVPGTLATTGITLGDYIVYAVDDSDNISAASPAITVSAASYIDLSNANPNQVQLYPVNVVDILHIKSNVPVASVRIYSLAGSQVINISTATDQVDMSGLHAGIYLVRVDLENKDVFIGKVSKR